MQTPQAYSVSELTAYLKHLLESDPILQEVRVSGEISNLTYHSSGHVYFSIKDSGAQLSCVMFRAYAQFAYRMKQGDKVVVTGEMSIYPPRGNYQLLVRKVQKAGIGDLYQQFLTLKEKLNAEGLFDPSTKKRIPTFPNTIAVITSPTGAAVRDIIKTIRRRYNRGKVLVLPTTVQGVQGEASIIKSIAIAQKTDADVIVLARGGGSLEDLWNFNEESVARAIRKSRIPIVTGVGHETDVTIADFVADLRAATPTAAAERVAPDLASWLYTLNEYENQAKRNLQYFIDFKRQVLDDYAHRLEQNMKRYLRNKHHQLDVLETRLKSMDVSTILQRGYTLTLKNGEIQQNQNDIHPDDEIETVFHVGRILSVVKEKKE